MSYYDLTVFFMVVLIGIPIMTGFFLKSRTKRIFCWSLSIPLLLLTVWTIKQHSAEIDNKTQEIVGIYLIDTAKSKYPRALLDHYSNLVLHVNEDNSFAFSENNIFLSQEGSWHFHANDEGGFVDCKFSGTGTDYPVFVGNNYWGFPRKCFKDGNENDIIYFKRIGSK